MPANTEYHWRYGLHMDICSSYYLPLATFPMSTAQNLYVKQCAATRFLFAHLHPDINLEQLADALDDLKDCDKNVLMAFLTSIRDFATGE